MSRVLKRCLNLIHMSWRTPKQMQKRGRKGSGTLSYSGGGLSSSRVTLWRPTTSFTTTLQKISPQTATSLVFRREVRSINVVLIRPCTISKVPIPQSLTLIKEFVTQQIWCFLRLLHRLLQGRNLESLIIKEAILLPPSCRPRYQRT